MHFNTYKRVMRGYRDSALKRMAATSIVGSKKYHATAFEHYTNATSKLAIHDQQISVREHAVLNRYRHLVFTWNLNGKWRNV